MGLRDTGWVDADGEQFELVNLSDVPTAALEGDRAMREVARRLRSWRGEQVAEASARAGRGVFARGKYVASDNPYDQMRVAEVVAEDDVVSSVLETTEGLALQSVSWESPDSDLADVFNQLNADLNLDEYLRTVWRELEIFNQSITAMRWGYREYTPRTRRPTGRTRGDGTEVTVPLRKAWKLYVPTQVITLDPLQVVPVGMAVFGEDRLAWHADEDEFGIFAGTTRRLDLDPVMAQLMVAKYRPGNAESQELSELGVNVDRLIELDPSRVWRVTIGRPKYRRFPTIRLKTLFRTLDMKQQLWAADRVALVGNADYILLVRQGTKEHPGQPAEIEHLKQNFRVIAQMPVVIADHRLTIDIITPATDHTLDRERYDLLDERILSRMLGSLSVSNSSGDVDAQVRARSIARALESRRLLLRREVERRILGAIWRHPFNAQVFAKIAEGNRPSLAFSPRNIQVDNDSIMQQVRQAARQAGELSRRTFLESIGEDMEVEAQRLEYEKRTYPDWVQRVPFNSPSNAGGDPQGGEPSATSGARGGRPTGGGRRAANSRTAPRTSTGNPST